MRKRDKNKKYNYAQKIKLHGKIIKYMTNMRYRRTWLEPPTSE